MTPKQIEDDDECETAAACVQNYGLPLDVPAASAAPKVTMMRIKTSSSTADNDVGVGAAAAPGGRLDLVAGVAAVPGRQCAAVQL